MRLTRLELRDFKAFKRLDLALEPATLLVGANDAGKSTIIEAIALLLDAHFYQSRMHRSLDDVAHDPSGLGTLTHDRTASERVSILGTFEDLNDVEAASWRDAIGEAAPLRIGRRWDQRSPEGETSLVLDAASLRVLETTVERVRGRNYADDFLMALDEYDGNHWCPFEILFEVGYGGDNPHQNPMGRLPVPDDVLRIPGPEEPVPAPELMLRPLVRAAVAKLTGLPTAHDRPREEYQTAPDFGPHLGPIVEAATSVVGQVSDALDRVVTRYVVGALGASVTPIPDARDASVQRVVDELTGSLHVSLVTTETYEGLGVGIEHMGAGVRRAALLATLDLYRDPDLWSPDRALFLLVEEPEIGLHAGAQRRVARALAALPAYGVQTIVVAHSPTFVSAFPPSALRLVRTSVPPSEGRSVVLPNRVREVGEALDLTPSDVLMAQRFLVVEGRSDVGVLDVWARTLGLDLGARGVRIVAAGGESRTANLAQFVEVAYEGASFMVLLDGGSPTEATAADLRARFRERIEVRRLERDQLEAYYTSNAVKAWLAITAEGLTEEAIADVDALLADGVSKEKLKRLSYDILGRTYRTEQHGVAIARLMREEDIALELKGLLLDITADETPSESEEP